MRSDVEIKAFTNPARRSIDFWLWKDDHVCGERIQNEDYSFAGIRFVKNDALYREPGAAFSLMPEDAQVLMDSLWDCGLRPQAGAGTAGQLDATREHLADLRRITFHQLKIEVAR